MPNNTSTAATAAEIVESGIAIEDTVRATPQPEIIRGSAAVAAIRATPQLDWTVNQAPSMDTEDVISQRRTRAIFNRKERFIREYIMSANRGARNMLDGGSVVREAISAWEEYLPILELGIMDGYDY